MASVSVVFREKGIGTFRNPKGQFIARDTSALRAEYAVLAERAQANVVANIGSRLIRQTVSTGRLERVTASDANRTVDSQGLGFGIGVIPFLDKSEAKYWRTIEEGSKVAWADTPGGRSSMVGMQIRGKFGASVVGWRSSSWGPRPVAGPRWNAPRGAFNAMRKLPAVTIEEDIRPMYAYADVYEDGGVFDREAPEVVRDFLQDQVRRAILGT